MNEITPNPETRIALFQRKEIRRTIHNNEWWFSVVDVVAVLTDSANPRDYWFKMKIRENDEAEIELSTVCRQLKLESSDGKKYETDCANTEGLFRIIQSIPSPKAEPFKRKSPAPAMPGASRKANTPPAPEALLPAMLASNWKRRVVARLSPAKTIWR